ncbi:hypothetical protein EMPS_04872 [Entomortierella parvispora]|uniref:Uncharacterized protein n=1 Tax=Entomortierella parvispora TaxID=205924 RepID=A0A9P3H9F3_9FUNG|nr:hypothetical protein EMPS_04872 [Entomortierella parvispora]
MSFTPPDPTVFYPIPPGQLPPGFVPPAPGIAVRGIPIVVPVGLEMLISPEGFPVFVPDRSLGNATAHSSPSTPKHANVNTTTPTPTPPSRHNTISSQHSSHHLQTQQQQFTPPPPVPSMPMPVPHHVPPHQQQQHVSMPMPMPMPHQPGFNVPPPPPPSAATAAPPGVGLTFASIVASFRTSSESVSAWTFYSLGLNTFPGQKEIAITLRQRPGQYTLETMQPIMYQLYQQMNQQILSNRRPLLAGDIFPCRLQTPDMGPKDMAILLIHGPPEVKSSLPEQNRDVLYGLMATLDEMAVFAKYGAARCLTNMGSELETWPVPLWSDWSRPSLVKLDHFRGSLTERVSVLPTRNIVATLDTVSHRLTLVISGSALELIQADLQRFPPNSPHHHFISDVVRVTFLLDLDAGAQAYLTWRTGQDAPAIFNARPNPTSYHGCWVSLTGIGQEEEQSQVHKEGISSREDGIELKMRSSTWERLYQALMSKTPATVPVGSETVQISYA